MAAKRKRKRYRLTEKGKIAAGVICAAFVLMGTLLFMLSEGYFEHTDPQIVRLVSADATIPIYETSTSETPFTYVTADNAYGADAALISQSRHRYEIMLAGCRGWIKMENAELSEQRYDYPSYYTVDERQNLIHMVSTNLNEPIYMPIVLCTTPSWLKQGEIVYSYDGHYFYRSLDQYLADLNNRQMANSINSIPFYNYYQYLPMHSSTSLSGSQLNGWLNNEKADYAAASVLADAGETFIAAQQESGCNALLIYAVAMNESRFGTSDFAVNRYNLFGYNAVDGNTAAADTYESVYDCLLTYTTAHLNWGFFDALDSRYHGSHLGDKGSGLNVMYASDPYWGEKAAGYAYAVDSYYFSQDYNIYKIMIKTDTGSVNVRKDASTQIAAISQLSSAANVPILVLEEIQGESISGNSLWYKIQVDSVLDENHELHEFNGVFIPYSLSDSIGYVHSQNFIPLLQ